MSTRYTEFVATNDFKADPSTRAQHIQRWVIVIG